MIALRASLSLSFFTLSWALCVAQHAKGSTYDELVKRGNPVLYLSDPGGSGSPARFFPSPLGGRKTRLPNGDITTDFDGFTQYAEVASSAAISVRHEGAMTIEAWIRPATLDFPSSEGDGYVHWAGKGEAGAHEYVLRMYNRRNTANRPNRISGYAFNPQGGLGSGSYFQYAVTAGQWIHVALIIDTRTSRGKVVRIYKNGVLRDSTPLAQFNVAPLAGPAPLRIGTRDRHSFFKGGIGKFAIYGYALSESQLKAHVTTMMPK